MKQSEMQQIAKMMFEMMQSASNPTIENVVKSQASNLPTGLLEAVQWVVANKDWAKGATAIRFVKHAGIIYFQLLKGKTGLGKNRQLRKSAQGYYSVPFGTHALEGATVVKL